MEVFVSLLLLGSTPEVLSARDCTEVFGDVDATIQNHTVREKRLNFIIDSGVDVVVDHSYSWTMPSEVAIRSLELIDTSTDGTARVYLQASDEEIACDDGLYAISVDDSIGPDARVLAVLRRALLIEILGRLHYLLPEEQEPPRFRVSWSSRFGMPRPRTQLKTKPARRK